jgi:hypothetical protein
LGGTIAVAAFASIRATAVAAIASATIAALDAAERTHTRGG